MRAVVGALKTRRASRSIVASAVLCTIVCGCSSSSPSPLLIAGSWTGTASDAGAFQWILTQSGSSFSGTVTVFNVPNWNPSTVHGNVLGSLDGESRATFQQTLCLGALGPNGPCELTVATNGELTFHNTQLAGDYVGAEQPLRSSPGPAGVGTNPFVKGTLTSKRDD